MIADFRLTLLACLSVLTACQGLTASAVSPTHALSMVLPVIHPLTPPTSVTRAPVATRDVPVTAWQPMTGDLQALAEAMAPRMVQPKVDLANPTVAMLYAPYTNGPLIGIRYFVQYSDEDLKSHLMDSIYDLYRKQHYGSAVDIEPVEVFVDADSRSMAGVAFKTGQNQAYYKILVQENTWLTFKASALTAMDRVGEHPRIGVSTWNHLHDLPSVLQNRPYPPTIDPPVVPVIRLTDDLVRRWRFDRRHLEGVPLGDWRTVLAERNGL